MRGIGRLVVTALAGIALLSLAWGPARAGQGEMDLLSSYIGDWSGAGVMEGGKAPESFRCRLTVAKGNQAKINYSGRCALVNMNLSVNGTIAYDDKNRRYQAVMSSNAGFTGTAVGLISGDKISFDLNEKQTDKGGNDIRIGSKITLVGDVITVDFEVEFNNSGNVLTAHVPFDRS
ncbi:MAG: hypothetical protein ABL866_13275 [Devosia sp.]